MRQSFGSLHAKSSKSGRGKTLFDEEKVGGACCVRHGEASISVSVSDESRTLSPARHFSPAIAARFYSSLLCLFVPPRSIPHLTERLYTRTQVHTHYYCAGVRFHLPMKISPREKTNHFPFLIQLVLDAVLFFNYLKGRLKILIISWNINRAEFHKFLSIIGIVGKNKMEIFMLSNQKSNLLLVCERLPKEKERKKEKFIRL